MSYQVLARKWRPQDFASLVGQEPIVTALRNALREGRIAHAYLFSGIRGVGKTTAARVLAKALNCQNGPASDPCNHCTSCLEITRGGDLDVIEVDAATYSKVEQVRELTESLKYGPARDRYKVVVLDEVHRLSRQAFDALLKIVEEPPPHLVFIFATTEIEAVPATILSRCQEFHFRRVPAEALVAHLAQICSQEGISSSETSLRLIARAAEGSVRDAVALLDQLATFGAGTIVDEEASRMLGGLDTTFFQDLLAAILAGDVAAVVGAARRMEDEGWDPRHLYGQFLAYGRDALHLALGGAPEAIDLPLEQSRTLASLAREAGYENLLRLLNQLLTSEPLVRRSESGALAAEISWLKAAELPKLTRIEALLSGAPLGAPTRAPAAAGPAPRPPARQTAPAPVSEPAPAHEEPRAAVEAPRAVALAPEPPRPPAAVAALPTRAVVPAAPRAVGPIQALLDEISKSKQPLAAHLSEAQALSFADGKLDIVTPPGDTWLSQRLASPSNRAVLEEALATVFGAGAGWQLSTGEAQAAKPAASVTAAPTESPAQEHPGVQTLLDIFGGTIEKVEEQSP